MKIMLSADVKDNEEKKEIIEKIKGIGEREGLLILNPLVPSTMSIAPVVLYIGLILMLL